MARRLPVRLAADGRALLNLGSSTRVAAGWTNVDQSWLLRLAWWPRLARLLNRAGLVSDDRFERLRRLDRDVICWNLRHGIPYPDRAFDVVYHSHVLEHIEREAAQGFLSECHRVLTPGGTLRVVVPDLERLSRRYLSILDGVPSGTTEVEYDSAVDDILDQLVRRIPKARSGRSPGVRLLEAIFIGDTAQSGERHQWIYDRFSLPRLLSGVGFAEIAVVDERTSRIEGWIGFGLDTEEDGSAYKKNSLYVEAGRPLT